MIDDVYHFFNKREKLSIANAFTGIIFIFFVDIMLYFGIQKFLNYEQTRRWNNFREISQLPNEFKNFIICETEKILDLYTEVDTPKSLTKVYPLRNSSTLSSLSSCSEPADLSFFPSFSGKSKKNNHKKEKEKENKTMPIKPTLILPSNSESNPKHSDKINRITSYLSPEEKMIKLWNFKMPFLSDYILWNRKKIKALINNKEIYTKFAIQAGDGHRVNSIGQPGFVKTKHHGYKLKILCLFGKARITFEEISDSQTYREMKIHVYGKPVYICKH